MSEEKNELAPRQAVEFWSQFAVADNGTLTIKHAGGMLALAAMIERSGMGPKGMEREKLFVAMQMGSELGLSPMQSIRSIAVINGRPSLWGDAVLGLVRSSGLLDAFAETFDGDGDNLVAVCEVKRKGMAPHVETFGVADAKRARLWGKEGVWQQYPKRMLRMRARGFALRDQFGDVLSGIIAREEAEDIPAENDDAPMPQIASAVVPVEVKPVTRRRREPQPEVPVEPTPTPEEAEAIKMQEASE